MLSTGAKNLNEAVNVREPKPPRQEEECDVIGDLMGAYGKYQLLMTVLLSLFQVPNTFHISSTLYQAANKEFWCSRPNQLSNLSVPVWRDFSNSTDNCNILDLNYEKVTMFDVLNGRSYSDLGQEMRMVKCSSWEYNITDNLGKNWISQWDLVCDQESMKNVAEMFFLFGVAAGGIISGYLSDKFGRKKMLFLSAVFQTIFGIALCFPNSFRLLLILRALLGLTSVSVTYAGLILAIEFVDGRWKTIAGMYNLFPLPISYTIISGIAYLTQDFVRLQICIGMPGIFLCFLWFFIPESPRWLWVKGRTAEVLLIIRKAADMNNRPLPDDMEKILKSPTEMETDQGCLALFHSKYLRLVSFCFLCIWFSMNLIYYSLILNMNSFGGNVYLNTALAGLVEIPAIALAIAIIQKVGKKWIFCATFLLCGVACFIVVFIITNDELQWLKITFLLIGKFTISAGNTIMPVYTAELYPTEIRNAGVGACNVAAGFALVIVPYLSLLDKFQPYFLMAIIASTCFLGGFVVFFLPERMEKPKTEVEDEL